MHQDFLADQSNLVRVLKLDLFIKKVLVEYASGALVITATPRQSKDYL